MSDKDIDPIHLSADRTKMTEAGEDPAATRRNVIKLAAGVGSSVFILPGLAIADENSDDEDENDSPSDLPHRAEEKAPRGQPHRINEEYMVDPEDRNKDGWIEFETGTTGDLVVHSSSDPGERTFGGELGVNGISVTIEATIGDCKAEITIGAFGQSTTHTLTCTNGCQDNRVDGGAAFLDYEICYDWSDHELTYAAEVCIWHYTGWYCDENEIESVITK